MISKIYNFWQILKSNLWFVPAVFCFGFLSFVSGFYYVEAFYFQGVEYPAFFFQGTTDDAKSVTVTLLSVMITMATLAISITMVVLSLAASQLGPRLIKTFMADRKTKNYIGLFFGTVIACFALTIILHSSSSEATTPQMTISLVFLTCLINMFVFLGFVHHVAQSSIADNVILKVSNDLKAALRRLTKDIAQHDDYEEQSEKVPWPADFDQMSRSIIFEKSGYMQNIDYGMIVDIARKEDLRVKIDVKSGYFIVKGQDGVRLYTKTSDDIDRAEKQVRSAFILGDARTATQDIEYSIRHLVEIAIRALSPGINDSFTAMNVLDQLSGALAYLLEKETPSEYFYDCDGVKRIHAKQSSEADIIFSAFDQIRFNARTMPRVIRHLTEKIKVLAELAEDAYAREALREQVLGISHDFNGLDVYVPDRNVCSRMIDDLLAELS